MNQVVGSKYTVQKEIRLSSDGRILLAKYEDNQKDIQVIIKETKLDEDYKTLKNKQLESIDFQIIEAIIDKQKQGNILENIIQIESIFYEQNNQYIVSKYYPYGTLKNLVQQRKDCLDINTIINFCIQILKGLQSLHRFNIKHMNLNLESILIQQDENKLQLYLTDFLYCYIQKNNTCLKSINHLAPEVILMQEYDQSADIWSFGCLLHELLYDRPLFNGNSINDEYKAIKQFKQYQCNQKREEYKYLNKLISKCLNVDQKARIQIDQIIKRLQKVSKILKDQNKNQENEINPSLSKQIFLQSSNQLDDININSEQAQLNNLEQLITRYIKNNSFKKEDIGAVHKNNKKLLVKPDQISQIKSSKKEDICKVQAVKMLLIQIYSLDQIDNNQAQLEKALGTQKHINLFYYVLTYCGFTENELVRSYQFFQFLKNKEFQEVVESLANNQFEIQHDQQQLVNQRMVQLQRYYSFIISKIIIDQIVLNIFNFIQFIVSVLLFKQNRNNFKQKYLQSFLKKNSKTSQKMINPITLIIRYFSLVLITIITSIILLIISLCFETIFFLFKFIIFDFQLLKCIIKAIKHIFIMRLSSPKT
ncbi:hypothetical protein ABPG74_009653, partial [Tetrahymena malaccensis]